jgi:lambda family phage portal protein
MNFFKKIKSVFTKNKDIKNYNRGDRSRSYGSGSKFPGGIVRGDRINYHDHYAIRQKARDEMYDSLECRALVTSKVDTIIDEGAMIKPAPLAGMLGIPPEQAELWAEDVSERFHLWAKSKKSHRSRINNFYQNQRLYQLFSERDNDIFVRFYYGRDKDLINQLQIEFVDPNQIRGNSYTSSFCNYPVKDGIIRDDSGKEIGFKIWYIGKEEKYKNIDIPARGAKSGRIFMIHGYKPEYAGQGRGLSGLYHLLQELEDLTSFKISVLQKAINQSSIIGAIENEEQDASQPLEGRVAGPQKEYGISPVTEEIPDTTEEPIINWDTTPEATIRQPGSMLIGNLKRGDKIKYLQDTSPSAQFEMYFSSIMDSICASTGWSREVVLNKFSNNYSASRAILIRIWRKARIELGEIKSDFIDYVYEMWLSEEIAAGRISAPGWSDMELRQAWLNFELHGSPMPNIDPLKLINADKIAVELSAKTLDDVARETNGSSGKANRLKNARQFEELPEAPWNNALQEKNIEDTIDEKIEEDKNNA